MSTSQSPTQARSNTGHVHLKLSSGDIDSADRNIDMRCDGQLSSQSGSKEQHASSPSSPSPPPLTSFPHTPLLLLSLTLTQARSAHPHPHPWWHHLPDPPLPRRRNQEEQPRGAARSGSQEQQPGAAARSGSQKAWARQVVGQGQEAHAPHSQEAQPGGRSSSQQGGSKESAMAHGDNSEWPAPCTSVAPIAQPYREHAPCCLQV
ncbi:hypothetical protein QJQ45_020631 [Haematococcus lacustris]|nr:hypothetical protein QJQ45_020631 [Haematococcus lacustris]